MTHAALPWLLVAIACLHARLAAAQSTAFGVTYDPSSRAYLLENRDGLQHMIFADGSVDSVDRNLSPFDFRKPVGIGLTFINSLQVARLSGQVGVMVDGQGLYTLGADGHHTVRNIYQNAELPCERLDPRDFCLVYRSGENSGQQLVLYFHRTLGYQLAHWNGTAYEAPTGPLAALANTDEKFAITDESYSRLLPIGNSGRFVMTRRYAFASEPAPLSLLSDDGFQPIELPWPAEFSSAQLRSFRAVGPDLLVLATMYTAAAQKPMVFRISEAGGVATVDNLSSMIENDVFLDWLGIDAAGNAYAVRPSDDRLISYGLINRQFRDLADCPFTMRNAAITVHRSVAEPGVWAICGNALLGLRDGSIITTVTLREGIDEAHLVSTVGQPVNALVSFADGSFERLNEGARVQVERLSIFAAGSESRLRSKVAWEDGQRICQVAWNNSREQQRNYVECLNRSTWSEVAYGIEPPSDIYESINYTWALSKRNDATRLSRRLRQRQGDWETVIDLPATPLSASPQFVPTSAPDEVGLHIPTIGLYRFSTASGLIQLAVDPTSLALNLRPALSGGWLYAFCNIDGSTSDPETMVEACAFDAAGQRTSLGEYPLSILSRGTTEGFVPLARGAMFDTAESIPESRFRKHAPIVVFQNRKTPLATLFGEFRYSNTRPWEIRMWSSPDGTAFILKSDNLVVPNDGLYDQAFRFDGRRLESLALVSQSKEDRSSSSSETTRGSWTRLAQLWIGTDGVWRAGAEYDAAVPIRMDLSPTNIMINGSSEVSTVLSAAHSSGEAVLANERGLWFCPERDAPHLGAASWRIRRNSACEHRAFVGIPRQIDFVDDRTLLVLTGRELLIYDRNQQHATPLATRVMSTKFSAAAGLVWFADATNLHSLNLRDRSDTVLGALPAGVTGADVSLATESHLCTSKGLFHWTGPSPLTWTLLRPKCDAAAIGAGFTYAVEGGRLYQCTRTTCAAGPAVPRPEVESVVLGTQDRLDGGLLMAQGKEIFMLQGDAFRKCDIRWGYGDLPKVSVNAISSGLAVTAEGGVFGSLCAEEPIVYRLH